MIIYNSLKEIIEDFRTFVAQDAFLNSFGYGEVYDIGTSKSITYPLLWTTNTQASQIDVTNKNITPRLRFTFLFLDRYNIQEDLSNENGHNTTNVEDILSQQYFNAFRFLNYIAIQKKYNIVNTQIDVVTDETKDKLYGARLDVEFRMPLNLECFGPVN